MQILQWLRSLVFTTQIYLMMLIMGILFFPWALISRQGAYTGVKTYCRWVRWSAHWMVGLKSEIRGNVPQGEVIIASKHQSFFDIIMIVSVVARPKFIMKSSLLWAPILGQYGLRIGCVPVNRGKRADAIKKMLHNVRDGRAPRGQLIIYPQGTRVPPGEHRPFKVGTYVLYNETAQTCVPASTNVGMFWPKYGIMRKKGLAIVEFLEPISPGLSQDLFMQKLETTIETQSNELMKKAGFHEGD